MKMRTFKRVTVFALSALLLLSTTLVHASAPTGCLDVPDHHAGVVGENEITVRAYDLQPGVLYRIKLKVSYHENPRTPPAEGESAPEGYTKNLEFVPEGSEYSDTFIVELPDCHWQIIAGFTLYYQTATGWGWPGDCASKTVDIWSDCKEPPPSQPGTGTPGYWKNHPDAWPVDTITIGGITYSKSDAIEYLNMPEKGDKTFTMFRALVAAKLNVEIGNEDYCIAGTIDAADAWMRSHGPVGNDVKGNTEAWKEGEPLYEQLDDYNNGELCAPSRD